MAYKNWEITTNRYVAYLDILGFKNMVLEGTHRAIYEKLSAISEYQNYIEGLNSRADSSSHVKVITFSDSIFIFSKDDSEDCLRRFLNVVNYMLCRCIYNGIPVKGATSYGSITVDLENSLFFGKPLISAYELHDELLMYGVIVDGKMEKRLDDLLIEEGDEIYTVLHETPLKQGKAFCLILNWPYFYKLSKKYKAKNVYDAVIDLGYLSSGINKRYVDNTEDFVTESINQLKEQEEKEKKKTTK